MKIKKQIRFEAAHVLSGYEGACGNLHGHSYTGEISILGEMNQDGMLMDFNEIKKYIDTYDHAFIAASKKYRDDFEEAVLGAVIAHGKKHVVLRKGRPTAERIAKQMAEDLLELSDKEMVEVTLRETASSEVCAYKEVYPYEDD